MEKEKLTLDKKYASYGGEAKILEHPFRKIIEEFGKKLSPLDAPIEGRDDAIDFLNVMLNRLYNNTVIITGGAGTGKTYLVKGFMRKMGPNWLGFSLSLDKLLGQKIDNNPNTATAQEIMASLFDLQKNYQDVLQNMFGDKLRVLLFIDEAHKLAQDHGIYVEAMKEQFSGDSETAPVILATTSAEYRQFLYANKAFNRRFDEFKLKPLNRDKIVNAGINVFKRRVADKGLSINLLGDQQNLYEVCNAVYDDTNLYEPKLEHPAKMNKFCDLIGSYVQDHNVPLTVYTAREAIGMKLGVDLNRKFNIKKVEKGLNHAFFGQLAAKQQILSLLKSITYGLEKRGNTYGQFFFVGPTGTGKTQLAKLIADNAFDGQLVRFDMVNYMGPGAGEKFLHHMGNAAHDHPFAVFLLDEIEKTQKSPEVWQKLLSILDEGFIDVELDDGNTSRESLHNVLFIATSNLGHELLSIMNKNQDENINLDNKVDAYTFASDKLNNIREQIQQAFSPEFTDRFKNIVMFTTLTAQNKVEILNLFQKNKIQEFKSEHNINLKFPPEKSHIDTRTYGLLEDANDLDRFILDTSLEDSDNSGARRYQNRFDTLFRDALINMLEDNDSSGLDEYSGKTITIKLDKIALEQDISRSQATGGLIAHAN